MSLPACFPLVNSDLFNNLESQINAVETPTELQNLVNRAFAELSILEGTLNSQLSFLQPIEALLTAPGADLTQIVNWITSLINDFITPLLKPIANITSQLTEIATYVTALTNAINSVASTKFPGVTITIPTVSPSCTL